LIRTCGEFRISAPAFATLRDANPLSCFDQIGCELISIKNLRTAWQADFQVGALVSAFSCPLARVTILGPIMFLIVKIEQCREVGIRAKVDAPSTPAIAAIGSAFRDKGLSSKRDASLSSVARLNGDDCLINEGQERRTSNKASSL
jgi:hypothetical protein